MEKKFRYRNQTEQLLGDLGNAGRSIAAALWDQKAGDRVASLDETVLASKAIVEALGNPKYVDDVTEYSEYNITDSGWYVFCRIFSRDGTVVNDQTAVEGAAGFIAETGEDHIDVAIRFDVAASSQTITINWGTYSDEFVFRASDLAIRNLDYRTTFYVYDIAPFATWEFGYTADATFTEGKNYYIKDGDEYELATITAGDPVPAYYEHSYSYALTTDETFQDGTTYYTESEGEYSEAEVTTGEAVTAETYYVRSDVYTQTEDTAFDGEKTYYVKSGASYSAATVTENDPVPAYYEHKKLTFQGMTRNITYRFDEIIDCPSEFILPEIPDDGHGAWFEIRMRHAGSYSSTLVPPEGVKVATEHTQAETEGFNMVDLHYMDIDGVKLWRFMNAHSNFTKDAVTLTGLVFRKNPTTLSYDAGDTLDLTGAELVATYSDGHTKLVTADCTFTPASGATLTAANTALTASLTVDGVTETATVALTVAPPALSSIAFTTEPTTLSYTEGDTLDLTGAVVTATYADTSTADVTADCEFMPEEGASLTTEDTALTASYTENGVTKTATVALTINPAEVI